MNDNVAALIEVNNVLMLYLTLYDGSNSLAIDPLVKWRRKKQRAHEPKDTKYLVFKR